MPTGCAQYIALREVGVNMTMRLTNAWTETIGGAERNTPARSNTAADWKRWGLAK
jgi:hypothetical protein